jgi:iron(III) transport system substrate-binding protein
VPPPLLTLLMLAIMLAGCGGSDAEEVVLYTSLNEPTVRSVLSVFEERTGIKVNVLADTERDKTVGLVRTLLEERDNPRADVFWNSETAHTVRLKQEGVLERLDPAPKGADGIPARFRDPEGYWFGFAARARVLIVNTELLPSAERPTSMWDLIDARYRGRAALVRPVTGTTLTHVTALAHVLPKEEWERFLDGVLANECHLPPGNGRLAQLVGEGEIAFGFTDTSDYRMVRNEGRPVDVVYPDQDGIGTLLLPNSVARVRGGPNPENARRLIEFLISEDCERILAHHARGHIPLRPGVDHPPDVRVPGQFRAMEIDYGRVGADVEARLQEMNRRFP